MMGLQATLAFLVFLTATQLALLEFPTKVETVFAELQISETTERFQLNATSPAMDIRVTSEKAFQPLAVMMSLNSTSQDSNITIREVVAYDGQSNSYPMGVNQSVLPADSKVVMLNHDMLPSALPAGGAMGLVVEISNALGVSLDVTVMSIADSQVPIFVNIDTGGALPVGILENSNVEIKGNTSEDSIIIDSAFVDPEIHCETCMRVLFRPSSDNQIEVSFVTNSTDLGKAQKMTFWAMGEGAVTFNTAGQKNDNGTVSYAESIALSLDDQWRRTELDVSESDLTNITHLFGFSLEGTEEQIFYIKGVSFS